MSVLGSSYSHFLLLWALYFTWEEQDNSMFKYVAHSVLYEKKKVHNWFYLFYVCYGREDSGVKVFTGVKILCVRVCVLDAVSELLQRGLALIVTQYSFST